MARLSILDLAFVPEGATPADFEELIVAFAIYDHAARLRSYEILMDAVE